ncbi:MAG: hypothetical protein C0497_13295 [Gemmatimonas sp.]|nr:hypothetical protein [Gemmatimonas sp.]
MANGNGTRGARIAKLFRQYRGLRDQRTCDVEAICESDGICIAESSCQELAFTASLVGEPGAQGILLAPGQESGRRRFSIAHELGHLHIPTHAAFATVPCSDRSDGFAIDPQRRQREAEANQFAAELLMPFRWFSEDARRLDLALSSAAQLASPDRYGVSVMAAARRMLEVNREPGLLVVSEAGRLLWADWSAGWRWGCPPRGATIHADSLHAAVERGEGDCLRPAHVDFFTWVDRIGASPTQLVESAMAIPSVGQVMSLVWAPDRHTQ